MTKADENRLKIINSSEVTRNFKTTTADENNNTQAATSLRKSNNRNLTGLNSGRKNMQMILCNDRKQTILVCIERNKEKEPIKHINR